MDNIELRRIQIESLEDDYFARSDGSIWRKLRGRPRHKNVQDACYIRSGENWLRMLKPMVNGKQRNYLRVGLGDTNYFVHRLILFTFRPILNSELYQVNHLDRNTFNNRLENLEWCNNQENCKHAAMTQLPKSYKELEADWRTELKEVCNTTDIYQAQELGQWLVKYDSEKIAELLRTTRLTSLEIAQEVPCSHRAVRYWAEKLKIKRPTIATQIESLLATKDYTAKELAEMLNASLVRVQAILRKRKV